MALHKQQLKHMVYLHTTPLNRSKKSRLRKVNRQIEQLSVVSNITNMRAVSIVTGPRLTGHCYK